MKITDLSSDLLNEMIIQMNPKDACHLMAASKRIYNSIHESEKEALYWLKYDGPTAFIQYMRNLNKSYSKMQPKQKLTAKLLIQSHPTPEVLVIYAIKREISMEFLEQVLGRDIIEDKLRLIKKQSELNPRFNYLGNIVAATCKQFGYGHLEIDSLSERFEKLKSILMGIEIPNDRERIKQRILESTEPNISHINYLMRQSPLYSRKLLKSLTEFGANVHLAIPKAAGDPQIMQYLIENGVDVIYYKERDGYKSGGTPLHLTTKRGTKKVVKLLLEHGAEVNAVDYYRKTPLHKAATYGNKEVVESLLDSGAEVNATDNDEWIPLHLAVKWGNKEVVELLLDKGAKVNAADNSGCTPLHFAAEEGKKDVVELLLERGANINATDRDGKTPHHFAAKHWWNKKVYDLLLLQQKDIDTSA